MDNRNAAHDHPFQTNRMFCSIQKWFPIYQRRHWCWLYWLRSLNTHPTKMRRESYINTWLKDRLFSRAFSPSCKCHCYCFALNIHWKFEEFASKFKLFHTMHSHSLLDQKINNVLSISNDQAILKAIQSIIQNMLATEDPSQQQLHFLQSCGFGGLWRFAGPFTKTSVSIFDPKHFKSKIFMEN